MLDAPDEMITRCSSTWESSPTARSRRTLQAAEKALMAIRPYIRYFNSSKYIEDLANGEICLALGWNGDVLQAALVRAKPRTATTSST